MKGLILVHEYNSDKEIWINPDYIVKMSEETIRGTKKCYTYIQLTNSCMDIKENVEQIFGLIREMYNPQ